MKNALRKILSDKSHENLAYPYGIYVHYSPYVRMYLSIFISSLYIVLNCGDPGVPLHGKRYGKEFTYGEKVWYSCHNDTTLVGATTISCNEHGEWSNPRPFCRSMYSIYVDCMIVYMYICVCVCLCVSVHISVCICIYVYHGAGKFGIVLMYIVDWCVVDFYLVYVGLKYELRYSSI